ncbi:unnamed protein product (macronuclear) [Paramecium tetraurelia]|uniref:Uncharacterized protein n=1 Tax=Paramecium tetraurelia TaxID=5888 RepID=A0BJN4_PARTE|nr:uncharacterized protein GSPATT00029379001 [Paramecium tetraurelia]CAK58751.1 unnamed protein product [Paramecium tetraurelia]|eukprot:XP_001426149.1 hypothetical protein (macronuclear) [Paramecium tetraurelia strain d4-2]
MLKITSKSRTTLASTPQSTAEGNRQNLLIWDQMFGNFNNALKSRNQAKRLAASKYQLINDPICTQSPLHQPNPFQFNEKLRQGFREYLCGERSALNLVNECNHISKKEAKLKSRIKLIKRANMFANQLQVGNKYKSLHQQGLTDEEIEKKVRVFQRFEKIKKLIQRNSQTEPNEDNNLRDVQLFRQLYEVSEENKNKIKQRNLLTERANGQREFDNVKYTTHGYLRVKKVEKQNENTTSCDNKQFIKQKVRDAINDQLKKFVNEKQQKEQDILNKAKRKLLLKNNQYQGFQKDKYVLNDPLSKDVKLYAYMFMRNKEKGKKLDTSERMCQTTRNVDRPKHFIQNFNNDLTSRNISMSNDSSLNSMLEINIDNMYRTSKAIQNQILQSDSEKFVKRIKQFQKVQQLNSQIIKVNQQKLTSERKSILF